MYRWGSPRPADFAELWILFFFAVIGDCRLYRKNKNIKTKTFQTPRPPEIRGGANPKDEYMCAPYR